VMLGANVGSALVSYALSFDITLIYPALILAGLVIFRSSARSLIRNLGRAVVGLGLMLLALHLLVVTVVPGALTPEARELLVILTREPLLVLVVTAVLAWAMHSSIAAVLVIAALADAGLVGSVVALAMVLGANLGSAINPLIDAASGGPAALRLPVGNLINRLVGCALALPFLPELAAMVGRWESDPGRLALGFHLLLNVVLAVVCFFLLPALTRALQRTLADRPLTDDPATPRYLDLRSIAAPTVALANAARETLRMADVVEAMLEGSRELLGRDDRLLAVRVRRLDDVLDRLHVAIKHFLSELTQVKLGEEELNRLVWILAVALVWGLWCQA
ncbi:MAG: Na/Pi cotransporter family protein, partial [Hyphomicrobiaceae bacterium]